MEIQVLGVGNAFTSRYYNTSFLVQSDRPCLIDCPPALFRLLRERRLDPGLIDDVIITHVHGDHCAGLETLLLWKKYVQKRRVRLWTAPPVFAELKQKVFPSFADTFAEGFRRVVTTSFEEYASFHPLAEGIENELSPDLRVSIRYNWHPTPTLGLKIRGSQGQIGYSGDTCYRPPLLEALRDEGRIDEGRYQQLAGNWLWDCDLIYHEVEKGDEGPHTAEADLMALPTEIRSRLRLIHLADDFEPDVLPLAEEGEIARFVRPGHAVIQPPAR